MSDADCKGFCIAWVDVGQPVTTAYGLHVCRTRPRDRSALAVGIRLTVSTKAVAELPFRAPEVVGSATERAFELRGDGRAFRRLEAPVLGSQGATQQRDSRQEYCRGEKELPPFNETDHA